MVHLETFWKPGFCGQTMLTDSSLLIGQKLVENPKIKTQMRHFGWFSQKLDWLKHKKYKKGW